MRICWCPEPKSNFGHKPPRMGNLWGVQINERRGHAGKRGASGSGGYAIPSLQAAPKQATNPAAAHPIGDDDENTENGRT